MRAVPLILVWLAMASAAAAQDRAALPVQAEATGRRVALVIGNSQYARTPLVNPVNDAADIGALLRDRLGFADTTVVTNVNLQEMERAIEAYLAKLTPGDVALFYYSGHGMQVDGENYLLPVDFDAADEMDVKYKAYAANRLRDRLSGRGVRLSILILDACRDNPYRSWRSESGKGLAGMGGAGSFVAFAAGEGKTADDNPGERNGLFTKHLLAALRTPGLTIDEVFNRAREGVYQDSHGRQTPFTYSGLVGEFRFQAAGAPSQASGSATLDLDAEMYAAVKDSRDPAQLEQAAAKIRRADLAGILNERARTLRSLSAPTASPAAPAPKLPAQDPAASAARGPAPGGFEGSWNTKITCPATGTAQGYTLQFASVIHDGGFHGERGTAGQPGYLRIEGKVAADGSAALSATGVVAASQYTPGNFTARGDLYTYPIAAQFKETAGTGVRNEAPGSVTRPCAFEFTKQNAPAR